MPVNQSNQTTTLLPARPWRVGLIGFGCVGQGRYDFLYQRPEAGFIISRIAVKNPGKVRPLPAERFEFDADLLLADDSLDVLVGVIDDTDTTF